MQDQGERCCRLGSFWTWRYMETSWCHWGWWGSILQRRKSFFTVYLQMNRLSNGLKWLQKMAKLWSFLASMVMLTGNVSAISVIWSRRLKRSNSFMQSAKAVMVRLLLQFVAKKSGPAQSWLEELISTHQSAENATTIKPSSKPKSNRAHLLSLVKSDLVKNHQKSKIIVPAQKAKGVSEFCPSKISSLQFK